MIEYNITDFLVLFSEKEDEGTFAYQFNRELCFIEKVLIEENAIDYNNLLQIHAREALNTKEKITLPTKRQSVQDLTKKIGEKLKGLYTLLDKNDFIQSVLQLNAVLQNERILLDNFSSGELAVHCLAMMYVLRDAYENYDKYNEFERAKLSFECGVIFDFVISSAETRSLNVRFEKENQERTETSKVLHSKVNSYIDGQNTGKENRQKTLNYTWDKYKEIFEQLDDTQKKKSTGTILNVLKGKFKDNSFRHPDKDYILKPFSDKEIRKRILNWKITYCYDNLSPNLKKDFNLACETVKKSLQLVRDSQEIKNILEKHIENSW